MDPKRKLPPKPAAPVPGRRPAPAPAGSKRPAPPPARKPVAGKPVRRLAPPPPKKKRLWIPISAAAGVLVVAVVGFLAFKKPPPKKTDPPPIVQQPPVEPPPVVMPPVPAGPTAEGVEALLTRSAAMAPEAARAELQKYLDRPDVQALPPRDPLVLRVRERLGVVVAQIQATRAEQATSADAAVEAIEAALEAGDLAGAEKLLAAASKELPGNADLEAPTERLKAGREAEAKLKPIEGRSGALPEADLSQVTELMDSTEEWVKVRATRLYVAHAARDALKEGKKLLEERIALAQKNAARASEGQPPEESQEEGDPFALFQFFSRPRARTSLDPSLKSLEADERIGGEVGSHERLLAKLERMGLDPREEITPSEAWEMENLGRSLDALPRVHYTCSVGAYLLGDLEEAAAAAARAVEREPRYGEAWLLRARVAMDRNRLEEAAGFLEKAGALLPDLPDLYLYRALLSIYRQKPEDAEAQLKRAKELEPKNVGLRSISRQLTEVIKGPKFTLEKPFEHRTKNYIVRTDISEELAKSFGDQLEQLRAHYAEVLGAEAKQENPVPVLIFKRRQEFNRYGGMPPGVLGYYSPIYRQFVFFDLTTEKGWEQDDLVHVMFHEGFHQYVREVIPNIPRWLNEALAEYTASARVVDGKLVNKGTVDPALAKMRVNHFDRDAAAAVLYEVFAKAHHQSPNWGYDDGWSLVHFLFQHEEGRQIKAYLKALREGKTPREANLVMPPRQDRSLVHGRWRKHQQQLQEKYGKKEGRETGN